MSTNTLPSRFEVLWVVAVCAVFIGVIVYRSVTR